MLVGKEIVLGVCGSIAAYKSVEILRRLNQFQAEVTVVLTKHASEFISPVTFQTLSKRKVITDLFTSNQEFRPEHVSLAHRADLLLVAPATANIIGKFAAGIADDFLSSLFLAMASPVMLAPAMNPAMYANPFVQKNLGYLMENGLELVEPAMGEVACGEIGQGRLAPIEDIVDRVVKKLSGIASLKGRQVLITAGPTREYLDPVRYLSNRSSGKMGFALAKAALRRGAQVILVSGPTHLIPPTSPQLIFRPVITTEEMLQISESYFPESSIAIMAAAVCDFQPLLTAPSKSGKESLVASGLSLKTTPDILAHLGKMKKKDQILVGFAAETDQFLDRALDRAQSKLLTKNLDFICLNNVTLEGAGFEVDTNIISILGAEGQITHLPLMTKDMVAEKIFDHIESLSLKRQP